MNEAVLCELYPLEKQISIQHNDARYHFIPVPELPNRFVCVLFSSTTSDPHRLLGVTLDAKTIATTLIGIKITLYPLDWNAVFDSRDDEEQIPSDIVRRARSTLQTFSTTTTDSSRMVNYLGRLGNSRR